MKNERKSTGKAILTREEWIKLLFDYSNANKCVPKEKIKIGDYNVGRWLSDQKKKIKNVDSDVYKKLSENEFVKINLDEYLEKKNKRGKFVALTFDESFKIACKYCDEYECEPKYDTHYDNYNLGKWLTHQKEKIKNGDTELYNKLSTNKYLKLGLDEYLEGIEKRKDDIKLSPTEWFDLVCKFSNKYERAPGNLDTYDNHNIGYWLGHQKAKIHSKDDELYIALSKNKYVKKSLDDNLKFVSMHSGENRMTVDKWILLLFEYCDRKGEVPPNGIIYDGHNIGDWLQTQKINIKHGDKELYVILSKNQYVKKNLDKYLKRKLTLDY